MGRTFGCCCALGPIVRPLLCAGGVSRVQQGNGARRGVGGSWWGGWGSPWTCCNPAQGCIFLHAAAPSVLHVSAVLRSCLCGVLHDPFLGFCTLSPACICVHLCASPAQPCAILCGQSCTLPHFCCTLPLLPRFARSSPPLHTPICDPPPPPPSPRCRQKEVGGPSSTRCPQPPAMGPEHVGSAARPLLLLLSAQFPNCCSGNAREGGCGGTPTVSPPCLGRGSEPPLQSSAKGVALSLRDA